MNRPDFSNYVAHFTKNADPFARADNPEDDAVRSIVGTAYERLVNILRIQKVVATPMPWTNRKAVAFTECPFWSLLDHAKRYSPYGVGFTKPHLFAADGGPAIYLRPDLFDKQMEFCHKDHPDWIGFHSHIYSFITPFAPGYSPPGYLESQRTGEVDFSHEREWRVPHDFTFRLDQVQFVIVKSYEDVAKFPQELKDSIGRGKFIILDVYRQIEDLWPTHRVEFEDTPT